MSKLVFKKVELNDAETLRPYLLNENSQCTDFTCGLVMMWKEALNLEFAIYNETFYLKGNFGGEDKFYLPCGKENLKNSIENIKEFCIEKNIEMQLVSVPFERVSEIEKHYKIEYTESRDYSDYVYLSENLKKLSGRAFHQKRNHISSFKKKNPEYKFVLINNENIDRVKDFYISFCESFKAESKSEIIERKCSQFALDNMQKIGLVGAFIETNGKIIAFTLGEIKRDVLFVHVEKADRNVKGSYAVINNEFVNYCAQKYNIKWVNREDDSGDLGLRKAKLSYKPDHLAIKGRVKFM